MNFNQRQMKIADYSIDTTDNEVLLSYTKTIIGEYPNVYFIDLYTNRTIAPIGLVVVDDQTIKFTFPTLPISDKLVYGFKDIFNWNGHFIGPQYAGVYSTTEQPPAPNTLPSRSKLSLCPLTNPTWFGGDTSVQPSVSPMAKLVANPCNSTISICKPSDTFYYELELDLRLSKGNLTIQFYQFTFAGQKYNVNLPILLESLDSIVEYQMNIDDQSYQFIGEGTADLFQPYEPPSDKMVGIVSPSTFKSYIRSLYDKEFLSVTFGNGSVVPFNFDWIGYLAKPSQETFIFNSKDVARIIILVKEDGNMFYMSSSQTKFCPTGSPRNSGYVGSTHYLFRNGPKMNRYQLNSMVPKITRTFRITLFGKSYLFNTTHLNHDDDQVKISFHFNDASYDWILLGYSMLYPESGTIKGGLFIPDTQFGSNLDQIGVTPDKLFNQPNFCSQGEGSGLRNNLNYFVARGDSFIPNYMPFWSQCDGTLSDRSHRTKLSEGKLTCDLASEIGRSMIQFNQGSIPILQPFVSQPTINRTINSNYIDPCEGEFTVDVCNSGQVEGLFFMDFSCNNEMGEVLIELINRFQIVLPGQCLPFSTRIVYKEYPAKPLQCRVDMSINKQLLWIDEGMKSTANFIIPMYPSCTMVNPCLEVICKPKLDIIEYHPSEFMKVGHFLYTSNFDVKIKNSGDAGGYFKSTLNCSSPIIKDSNFEHENGLYEQVTYIDSMSNDTQRFQLLVEPSPTPNTFLECKVMTTIMNPSRCWSISDTDTHNNTILTAIPYDPLVE
ncbi:hypothetical protein SAMD00019534_040450 [Acytostelium subglobosum LB1]|uniref:hypothetical protein n=1 Tax=Acytostelium subglobosum LB1 TaxID=1410327 RepID=UPI000644D248|nr:hypothetical protein SAMD00019534_040450 [Acytostelium subglobosum LB1]GAM20870.1 hypothetical protein SAMD00019534_040450 [Acytostelium subglobosum LB1]|eukprot:XP_012756004.1 hypothetical protein SAMD00019534_040450 [Acytostelium subglobosum LB1]